MLQERIEIIKIRYKNDPEFHRKLILNDEAHSHLGDFVNKQNWRIWGPENSRVIVEKPLYPQRVKTIDLLREKFPDRVICLSGDHN